MNGCSQHSAQKYFSHGGSGIGISLAGGGYRAAVFHLGALRRLNEYGILSQASIVSAVAGGAITAGVLARRWHELRADARGVFQNLEDLVLEPVEHFTNQMPRLKPSVWEYLLPWKWGRRRKRKTPTDMLAAHFDRQLFRGVALKSLPASPRFVFTATSLKTGGLWEFDQHRVGEVILGYTSEHKLRLADAVAACCAPLEFPPSYLRFDANTFGGGVLGPRGDGLRREVTLVEGAVHDNLAIEPLWRSVGTVICCDGSSLLHMAPQYEDWFGNRLMRAYTITHEQTLETRKRWLMNAYLSGQIGGAYIGLSAYHGHYGVPGSVGYPTDVVEEIRRVQTNMSRLSWEEIMAVSNHGYTMADVAIRRYMPEYAESGVAMQLPYPDFVDRNKILNAIEENDYERAQMQRAQTQRA